MVSIQVCITFSILCVLHGHAVNGLAINETNLENISNTTHLEFILSNGMNRLLRLDNSYYAFHTDPQTWNAARKICNSEGGYLAIMNSDDEAQYLTAILNGLYPLSILDNSISHKSFTFIGFHDYFQMGEYVTIDGLNIEKSGYTRWASGEPSSPGVENCGTIERTGFLNDYYCDSTAMYICEIPVHQ